MEGFLSRFFTLYRPLITVLNELLGEYELSYSLWQVVSYVESNGPSMLTDISNYYNVEKPTITRRVYRLEELRIIEEIDGPDRREKVIQLTEQGKDVYRVCRRKITELEQRIMEGIPPKEQHATFQTLPKIKNNIVPVEEKQNG